MRARYLVIDTETTGLHPAKHGMIQLAAAVLGDGLEITDTFNMDVRPPSNLQISEEALKYNGFSLERIRNGHSYKEVAEAFLKFLETNFSLDRPPILVGQFFPFDYAVMEIAFTIAGYEEEIMQKWLTNDFIDTKALAHSLNLKARLQNKQVPFESTSLSKPGGLRYVLNLPPENKAHDAMGDVFTTREALIALMKYLA